MKPSFLVAWTAKVHARASARRSGRARACTRNPWRRVPTEPKTTERQRLAETKNGALKIQKRVILPWVTHEKRWFIWIIYIIYLSRIGDCTIKHHDFSKKHYLNIVLLRSSPVWSWSMMKPWEDPSAMRISWDVSNMNPCPMMYKYHIHMYHMYT